MGIYYSAKDAKIDCIRNYYKDSIEYESLDQILNLIKQVVYINIFSKFIVNECKFDVSKDKIEDARYTATILQDKLGYSVYILTYPDGNASLEVSWEFNIEKFINEINDSDPELADEFSRYIDDGRLIDINAYF